jgi:Xaa-Pro aminopeptidase
MGYLPAYTQPGVREYEIRSKIMQLITDLGGEEMIVTLGSAPNGDVLAPKPSFFQNRELQTGDLVYVQLQCSGPGGYFTTLGRMMSIAFTPGQELLRKQAEAEDAQAALFSLLKPGAAPEEVLATYNAYLTNNGYNEEAGLFAHGQGYDHVERPSIQHGESMKLAKNMCLAVKTSLVTSSSAFYCADSILIRDAEVQKLHRTPLAILRA